MKYLILTIALLTHLSVFASAESTSSSMSFEKCQAVQANTIAQLNVPPEDIVHIVNTSELTMTRFYTADGSIIISCSKPDQKMVITKSTESASATNAYTDQSNSYAGIIKSTSVSNGLTLRFIGSAIAIMALFILSFGVYKFFRGSEDEIRDRKIDRLCKEANKRNKPVYDLGSVTKNNSENTSLYRKCPFCGEEIKKSSIKCKHCQLEVDPVEVEMTETGQDDSVGDERKVACPNCNELIKKYSLYCPACGKPTKKPIT